MSEKPYEIAVIGGGPAGISAAVNARVRNKKVVLLESEDLCHKLRHAPQIDNYLGLISPSGQELSERFIDQFRHMAIEWHKERVACIFPQEGTFALQVKDGFYSSRAVIIAVGIAGENYLPGEEDYIGKGIAYCVTCDSRQFKGKKVAVVGHSREAEEDVRALAEICREVVYLPLYDHPSGFGENVEVLAGKKPKAIIGDDQRVTQLELEDQKLDVDGVFLIKEGVPASILMSRLEVKHGAIIVDNGMATNIPGIFAAGDCAGEPHQTLKAAGQGETAALSAVSYLDQLDQRLEKEKQEPQSTVTITRH